MKYVILFVLIGFSSLMKAQETPFVDGELIVQLYSGTTPEDIVEKTRIVNGVYTGIALKSELSALGNIWLLEFNHHNIDQVELLRFVRKFNEVRAAQFNHIVEERAVPNDPQYGSQWFHNDGSDNDIDTPQAWDVTTGGTAANGHRIVACVVEFGGANWSHTDLIGNHWVNTHEINNNGIDDDANGRIDDYDGWNVGNNTDNLSAGGHGTSVSGMIGATGNNSLGGVGVNWDVDIMQVQAQNLTEAGVILAYDYPYDMRSQFNATNGALGAFVVSVNSSWGIDNADADNYPVWCAFYDTMGAVGILNCGATANNNVNIDVVGDMPTACSSDYLISVTATNSSDVRTFSGYGLTTIDLGAPGEAVYLPSGTSGYANTSGTSFASPCVAGAIALLYSAPCPDLAAAAITNPAGTAALIRSYILDGVDPVANLATECVTGGRLNVNNSMNLLMANCGVAVSFGCTDITACNFDPDANLNDGSCTYPGCTDVSACNYNAAAGCADPGACIYGSPVTINMTDSYGDGWNNAAYQIFDASSNLVASGTLGGGFSGSNSLCLARGCYSISVSGGSFPSEVGWSLSGIDGSLSGGAPVSNLSFTVDNPVGCTNPSASNYDDTACIEDGSCTFGCPGDFDNNGVINTSDVLLFMAFFGCGSSCGVYDLDGNVVVNNADLLLLMAAFGSTCP